MQTRVKSKKERLHTATDIPAPVKRTVLPWPAVRNWTSALTVPLKVFASGGMIWGKGKGPVYGIRIETISFSPYHSHIW
jgi:hypothetical protein